MALFVRNSLFYCPSTFLNLSWNTIWSPQQIICFFPFSPILWFFILRGFVSCLRPSPTISWVERCEKKRLTYVECNVCGKKVIKYKVIASQALNCLQWYEIMAYYQLPTTPDGYVSEIASGSLPLPPSQLRKTFVRINNHYHISQVCVTSLLHPPQNRSSICSVYSFFPCLTVWCISINLSINMNHIAAIFTATILLYRSISSTWLYWKITYISTIATNYVQNIKHNIDMVNIQH